MQQGRIEQQIFLIGINADHVEFQGQPCPPHVQPDKMGNQQDDRTICQRIETFQAFDTHQPPNPRSRCPPQKPSLQKTTPKGLEMRTGQLIPF